MPSPRHCGFAFACSSVRERALDMQGRRAEQRADVEAMEALAEQIDDDRLRADAAKRRSSYSMRIRDLPTQVDAARRAREWAERAGDIELELRAQNLMASASAISARWKPAGHWRSRAWRPPGRTVCAGSRAAFSTRWR